jgi:hypothetical protein
VAIYSLFFAEVRYSLPIAILLFPPAGAAIVALRDPLARAAARLRRRRDTDGPLGPVLRPLVWPALAVVLVFLLWPAFLTGGAWLRQRHRFAAHVCRIAGAARLCLWRPAGGAAVLGVWDGVGVSLAPGAAAETALPLPAGRYRMKCALDLAPSGEPPPGTARLFVPGLPPAAIPLARLGSALSVIIEVNHPGGDLHLRLAVDTDVARPVRVWLSQLEVEGS